MNKEIEQELGFIYICNGKKFLDIDKAIKHQKYLNKKHFNFFK